MARWILLALLVVAAGPVRAAEDPFCDGLDQLLADQEPPEPARLRVDVQPDWGKVYLDGEFLAVTPMEPKEVSRGEHCIRVTDGDGEASRYRQVTLRSAKLTVVLLNLESKKDTEPCAPAPKPMTPEVPVRVSTRLPGADTRVAPTDAGDARRLCSSRKQLRELRRQSDQALVCTRGGVEGLLIKGSTPGRSRDVYVDGTPRRVRRGVFAAQSLSDTPRIIFDLNPGGLTAEIDALSAGSGLMCFEIYVTRE